MSNAMGPFSAIYDIWSSGEVRSKVPTQEWVLAIGGVGISVGLALFGWRIIQILGVKVAKVTNARGFSAEFATATTVAVASRYGEIAPGVQLASAWPPQGWGLGRGECACVWV